MIAAPERLKQATAAEQSSAHRAMTVASIVVTTLAFCGRDQQFAIPYYRSARRSHPRQLYSGGETAQDGCANDIAA
jgi:hypothetical protein